MQVSYSESEKSQKFLHVKENALVLDEQNKPRDGWEEKFEDRDTPLLIVDNLDLKDWDEL